MKEFVNQCLLFPMYLSSTDLLSVLIRTVIHAAVNTARLYVVGVAITAANWNREPHIFTISSLFYYPA